MKWGWIKYVVIVAIVGLAYELVVWRNLALDHKLSEYTTKYNAGRLKVVELIDQISLYEKFSTDIWYMYDGDLSFRFLSHGNGSNKKRTNVEFFQYKGYDFVFIGDFNQSYSEDAELYSYPTIYILEPNEESLRTRLVLRHDPYVDLYRKNYNQHIVHCDFDMGYFNHSLPKGKKWQNQQQEQWQEYFDKKKNDIEFKEGLRLVFDKLNLDKSCLERI